MNGPALQVQQALGRDPHIGDLYVFRGKRGDLVKILWHDGLGMSLYAKRLERGQAAPVTSPIAAVRKLTARDITPEHERVLASVPVRTLQAIAALYERRAKGSKFSALDVASKLNVIFDITTVPYRTMRDHLGRPGELGLLMGKGLADSQKAG